MYAPVDRYFQPPSQTMNTMTPSSISLATFTAPASAAPEDEDAVTARHSFPLRFTDFDVLNHVNNAVYWEAVEEELARRRELRAPLRAELEHRAPIEPGASVEVAIVEGPGAAALWLREAATSTIYATATIAALDART